MHQRCAIFCLCLFLLFTVSTIQASTENSKFFDCCEKHVSPSCAKHCKYHNSIYKYTWAFLKGDCNFETEHEILRQCFYKMRDNTECCARSEDLGKHGYKHCLELCDGTRKALSKSIWKYAPCKRYLKDVVKCAKSS